MREEVKRKVRAICEYVGTDAALAEQAGLTEDLTRAFDERVAAGMSEVDAYRDVFRSADELVARLRALPARQKTVPKRETASQRTSPAEGQNGRKTYAAPRAYAAGAGAEAALSREEGRKTLASYIGAASGCLWVGTTILYFLGSMVFHNWAYSWLIFLWAAMGQVMLGAAEEYNRTRNLPKVMLSSLSACLWIGTTILYFLSGFFFHLWAFNWLLFLCATIVQILMSTLIEKN